MAHRVAAAKCRQGALLNAVILLSSPQFLWSPDEVVDQIEKKWHCLDRAEAEQIVRWAIESIVAAEVFADLGPDDELDDSTIPLVE
jgi:hypothetical protein